jgi:uncharacterized protein
MPINNSKANYFYYNGFLYFTNVKIIALHYFINDKKYYAFDYHNLKAYSLTEKQFNILSKCQPYQALTLREDEYNELLSLGFIDQLGIEEKKTDYYRFNENISIHYLTLNVVEFCNLSCKYCFAQHEFENGKKMSIETAYKAVDWFAKNWKDGDAEILFFGGEPLLNFKLINKVVDYSIDKFSKKLNKLSFGITTNGTVLSKEIVEFLYEKNFKVAVSIDAGNVAHDENRIAINNRASYERILENIKLMSSRGIRVNARCTLYGFHNNIKKLKKDLSNLKLTSIQVSIATPNYTGKSYEKIPVEYNNNNLISEFEKNLELETYDESKNSEGVILEIIERIKKKNRKIVPCGIGRSLVNVSSEGSIYPCHRFSNLEKYKLGNLDDESFSKAIFEDLTVDTIPACKVCWAKYLCGGGCLYNNAAVTGDILTPSKEICVNIQKTIEYGIAKFVNQRVEPNKIIILE